MISEAPNQNQPRVLIVGIDAATMDLIRPWAQAGQLPTFQRLFHDGASGLLRSVPNRNSAAAWTSMLTGRNPGKHGLFYFWEFRPGTLEIDYVNGSRRVGPAVWNLLSQAGKHVGVMNVPMTFPAEEVNGFMISGMDAPGVHDPRFIYPPDLHEEIQREAGDYVIESGIARYVKSEMFEKGAQALYHTTQVHLDTARYLMTNKPWDFFMTVFRVTDPAQHRFWKYMQPDGFRVSPADIERFGQVIPNVYKQIDAAMGQLIEVAGPDTITFVVSDHGAMADTGRAMTLPRWLEAIGVMRRKQTAANSRIRRLSQLGWTGFTRAYPLLDRFISRRLKKRLSPMFRKLRSRNKSYMSFSDVDWAATRAFSDGHRSEIWVNLKGRQPFGIVAPGQEYKEVCECVTEKLYEARDADSGKPLVQRVYHSDDVYHGPFGDRSPDLTVEWTKNVVAYRFNLGDGKTLALHPTRGDNPGEQLICGEHDCMGILFMTGGPVRRGLDLKEANIMDIAPTVLYLLGEPIPEDVDGGILFDVLDPDYVASHPSRTSCAATDGSALSPTAGYSQEDEAIIEERLRGLGYIE